MKHVTSWIDFELVKMTLFRKFPEFRKFLGTNVQSITNIFSVRFWMMLLKKKS